MFGFGSGQRTEELRKKIERLESERDTLVDRNTGLRKDNVTAAHKHKLQLEDTKHLVKMREEALQLEFDKKALANEREKDTEVATVKDGYRDKMEKQLGAERDNIKSMYESILERLPKVSVRQMDGKTEHTEKTG